MNRDSHSNTTLLRKMPLADLQIVVRKSLSQKLHLDFTLLMLILLVMGYGLLVLFSATNGDLSFVYRQIANFVVGLFLLYVLAQFDILVMWRYIPAMYLAGIATLAATAFFGISVNGAQRWLGFPGVLTFQPSEFLKILVPLMVVWTATRRPLPVTWRPMLVALVVIAVPSLLVLRQPDLGTAIIISGCGMFSLFLGGLSYRMIAAAALLLILSIPFIWNYVLYDYHKRRVITFLDPEKDMLGNGWNAMQSMIAIGSGGALGKGWMTGTQATLGFLPESHTDFIFSVLAEDFGYMGFILLLLIYLATALRCFSIAKRAQQTISRMVAASLTMMLMVYVFINIGMVSGLLPVVGVPLPFISYGGTSAVSILMAFGIIMSIATHKRQINR